MKQTIVSFIFFIFISSCFAVVPGDQTVIPANHWVYDNINTISIECGKSYFSSYYPLTQGEIKNFLNNIPYDNLSSQGKILFDEVLEYMKQKHLNFTSGIINIGMGIEASLESFYKTNENIDWSYNYNFRNPLLRIPLGFSISNYFTVETELSAQQNILTQSSNANHINVPYKGDYFDVNFPHYAYGSVGYIFQKNTGINLTIARAPQSLGRTKTGSIIISPYSSNESYATLSIFSPTFRYGFNITQVNPPVNNNPLYLYLHRLDFLFWNKVSFSISEGMLINAPIELRFFNPLMIFHSYASWRDYYGKGSAGNDTQKEASLLAFNIDYVPINGIRLYFVYAQNQFQTYYERKNWPEAIIPNAFAFQVGLNVLYPLSNGYITFDTEFVYTSAWMYLMSGKDWSFVRKYGELIGNQDVKEWMGSPFGPDSISAYLSLGYFVPKQWGIKASYLFSCQGENSDINIIDTNYWPTTAEKAYAKTPTGIPSFTNKISIQCNIDLLKKFSFNIIPTYTFIINNKHKLERATHCFEIALSCKYTL